MLCLFLEICNYFMRPEVLVFLAVSCSFQKIQEIKKIIVKDCKGPYA